MSGRPSVAIVGAGPAGLVVAHLLQREAIPFVVFERQALADLASRPKAGLVEYRTVQLLAQEGIAGSILQFTTENHRSEFRTPEESVLLEYAALTGGRPHYIYPQHELVQQLCEALTAAGGEVRFGHTVRAVTADYPGGRQGHEPGHPGRHRAGPRPHRALRAKAGRHAAVGLLTNTPPGDLADRGLLQLVPARAPHQPARWE